MKPQDPVKPYPYLEKEVTFTNPTDGMVLKGTLTLPEKTGKFPAVVLVTGSGAQDRNEDMLGHRPFLVLADYLTRAGIAVLRYDDRHFKMPVEKGWSYTTLDLATDASAAVDYLKSCEAIHPGFIGICGHSEGGLIAAIVASQRDDVGFAISLAGPGMSGAELGRFQAIALSADDKGKEFALAQSEICRTEPDMGKRRARLLELIRRTYRGFGIWKRWSATTYLPITSSPWQHAYLSLEPATYWKKTRCPALAVFGEYDMQVPLTENLEGIRDALIRGGNPDFEIVTIPGTNHLFQKVSATRPKGYKAMLKQYAASQETLSPQVLERVKEFILRRIPR